MTHAINANQTPTIATPSLPALPKISARELLPYAFFIGLVGMIMLYFAGVEQGVFSVFSGTGIHEWVHDARHLLGFPCH